MNPLIKGILGGLLIMAPFWSALGYGIVTDEWWQFRMITGGYVGFIVVSLGLLGIAMLKDAWEER